MTTPAPSFSCTLPTPHGLVTVEGSVVVAPFATPTDGASVGDDQTMRAAMLDLAAQLRAAADTDEFAAEVQARLTSLGSSPIAATANYLAELIEAMTIGGDT